ncbi:FAD-binding oxidoreductase [Bacillus luteolus]|uniref:FAD-binding oxidoreductase n=1 Tax=Litchfieldia luteola TaxID=682179 RepID=A0ABR9QIV5_9BACI|nr:FAD-binding oxidoreductase [Cytobacillus luteolus]MBE4908437.1 FAD-binding oxidoreductase [Cytobacillus luteolus]MBP1941283.1 D-amino-acid dehydrogenase [Cytobacillus luteolus]
MKPFIIIGAGILGASTAYHLAKNGAKVLLIDREDKGQATDAAAGIVCPWISQRRNKAWYQLAKNGASYYSSLIPELEKDGEKDTGYKRVGAISLHTDSGKLDKMEERAYKRREDAPEIGEITRLSEVESKKLFPYLDEKFASVHISGAARVNGRALRNALVKGAEKHGAEVLQGNARLEIEAGKVVGVTVGSDSFLGEKVIVTAGAWAKELIRPLGIEFLVDAQKAQIVHLQVDEHETAELPVVMPPNDQYIVAFDEGKIVIGATHENDKGFDKRVTVGGLHEVLDKALGVAPGLEESTVSETRVGFRPFTPGFLPVIGSLPNNDEVLVANGLGASGLTVGPYLGFQLAKLALDQPLNIDLKLYPVSGAIL